MRNDIYDNICAYHDISVTEQAFLLELIEKRLIAKAEAVIEQNDDVTMSQDDFDPFGCKYACNASSLADEIYQEYKTKQ